MSTLRSFFFRVRRLATSVAALNRFVQTEVLSGIALLVAAAVALVLANSPWSQTYQTVVHPMEFWVNDVLMALFFLVVSLEIRRELHSGALSSWRVAVVPIVAATGGIVVPAAVYVAVSVDPEVRRGWAIPTATDIAFAVGVLALLGDKASGGLRAFLLALAIIDDIVAIVLIAILYSVLSEAAWITLAVAGCLAAWIANSSGVRSPWIYALCGAAVWLGLYCAGVHPTLAGVLLAFVIPTSEASESVLHALAAFVVMPLFAFVNAGVPIDLGAALSSGRPTPVWGVVLGFVLGKPLGIFSATYLAVRLGGLALPDDVNWRGIATAGCVAGIGFTMALFLADLAFAGGPLLNPAKFAIVLASLLSAMLALALGLTAPRMRSANTGAAGSDGRGDRI